MVARPPEKMPENSVHQFEKESRQFIFGLGFAHEAGSELLNCKRPRLARNGFRHCAKRAIASIEAVAVTMTMEYRRKSSRWKMWSVKNVTAFGPSPNPRMLRT